MNDEEEQASKKEETCMNLDQLLLMDSKKLETTIFKMRINVEPD